MNYRELYQETLLDHNKAPRNFHSMADATHRAHGDNPLCGDKVDVFLKMDGDLVADISFQGSGCAISTASASMLTAALKGRTRQEAFDIFRRFHGMVTGPPDQKPGTQETEALGKLVVFMGVREYPMRVKCATLSWHTMKAALDNHNNMVSTE